MAEYWSTGVMGGLARPNTPLLQYSNAFAVFAMAPPSNDAPLAAALKQIAGLQVKIAEPLARYTSMKIGGPADWFVDVENQAALAQLLALLSQQRTDFCLLGNGSNVLISDLGVRGVVIRLSGEFKRAEWRGEGDVAGVQVGAAKAITQLVREASRRGYAGLEFAEGIPGTVGGALVMNAGAYGSEFEKIVDGVDGLTREGRPVQFTREQMTFTYRDSHLPARTVVTGVRLSLRREESFELSTKVRQLVTRRKASQPSGYPNSGSMFRNPVGDFAGRLIEAAGLKGKTIGQAQISAKHGNFIVNLGGAKAEDVRRLMEMAQAQVKTKFAVELVAEVKLLGEWPSIKAQ
ncbi:MAG: UDP-N-acetylmuramate dehydrogenase [Candidatus Binatia bacterium]